MKLIYSIHKLKKNNTKLLKIIKRLLTEIYTSITLGKDIFKRLLKINLTNLNFANKTLSLKFPLRDMKNISIILIHKIPFFKIF